MTIQKYPLLHLLQSKLSLGRPLITGYQYVYFSISSINGPPVCQHWDPGVQISTLALISLTLNAFDILFSGHIVQET